jgi:hypothetical protein
MIPIEGLIGAVASLILFLVGFYLGMRESKTAQKRLQKHLERLDEENTELLGIILAVRSGQPRLTSAIVDRLIPAKPFWDGKFPPDSISIEQGEDESSFVDVIGT